MSETELLLALLLLAVAALYSSVGHAGASGYIAAMALLGFAPEQLRPTALALNLQVAGIGLVRFWRAGQVQWRNVLPFVLTSAPAAYLAAQIQLPTHNCSVLLGLVLLAAATGAFHVAGRAPIEDAQSAGHRVPWLAALQSVPRSGCCPGSPEPAARSSSPTGAVRALDAARPAVPRWRSSGSIRSRRSRGRPTPPARCRWRCQGGWERSRSAR